MFCMLAIINDIICKFLAKVDHLYEENISKKYSCKSRGAVNSVASVD